MFAVPVRLMERDTPSTSPFDCPVGNLPVELHSAIFLIGQAIERLEREMEILDEEEFTGPSSPFEVRVSHVNARWRSVALNTGQLWTDFVVQPGYSSESVEAYFSRSKQCLLDIQLRDCPETSITTNILSALFQDSIRWRSCIIEAGLDSWTMNQIVPIAAPNLERVEFVVRAPDRARRFGEIWQGRPVLNGGCPRLKQATLRGFALHFARPPLSSVTRLHLDYRGHLPLNYDEFRELLTKARSLENFSINGVVIESMPRNHTRTVIVLPKLLRLGISSLHGQVYSGILLTVKAPLLQSLILEGAQDSDLDPFLDAPYDLPHLRSFSLCGSAFAPLKLNKIYVLFPSLEEIVLMDMVFNPSEILRVVSESIRDLGLAPLHLIQSTLSTSQEPQTLVLMLNPDQRSDLRELLQQRLVDEEIVDLDNSKWSFIKFFDWLQHFVTAEILLSVTT
ncbi:uncharacterized protein C8R40DRAFT_287754 [Lentinula edodes]|uniref:uncharacterized protein n=1 Tax=Lentinula edodes TaxID=5353 RepID=UPI001E8E3153|nr:uncharacterized protein C8R40DRAFT_287754 [Lentinula edodes]KAH7874533.1 hypothetical protein C8R40DRAFT_287754 [Lentinula edodes]